MVEGRKDDHAPERHVHRIGFAASSDRLYFTLNDRKADVWVAEMERKQGSLLAHPSPVVSF